MISADAIQRRVREMAEQISRDYQGLGRPLILLSVLKGSVCFATDLSRSMTVPINFDYVAVSSYGAETQSSGHVQLLKDLTMDVTGRDVLMVEDIIDTGLTTSFLFDHVQRHQPKSLKLCVLLNKEERRLTSRTTLLSATGSTTTSSTGTSPRSTFSNRSVSLQDDRTRSRTSSKFP